jgi:ubiquinone/menaquinone biosynthesis C-methylase UbiE
MASLNEISLFIFACSATWPAYRLYKGGYCHTFKAYELPWLKQCVAYEPMWDHFVGNNMGTQYADLHRGSGWGMLATEFAATVLDAISYMDPPVVNSSSVFEVGVGVGASLKVLGQRFTNLTLGGSDNSRRALEVCTDALRGTHTHFVHNTMPRKHADISDTSYDHVVSVGAAGVYLLKDELLLTIEEMNRILKHEGSLLVTHLVAPGEIDDETNVVAVPKEFWSEALPALGLYNIRVHTMLNQKRRYLVSATKKAMKSI